jgi:hypothetical protein
MVILSMSSWAFSSAVRIDVGGEEVGVVGDGEDEGGEKSRKEGGGSVG